MGGQKLCDNKATCCDLYLGTDHVLLDQVNLGVLDLIERQTMTEVIAEIDRALHKLGFEIRLKTRMVNIGEGEEVYNGFRNSVGHEMKTLKGNEAIKIESKDGELRFSLDYESIPNYNEYVFNNLGKGIGVFEDGFKDGNKFVTNLRSILSKDFVVELTPQKEISITYTPEDRSAIEELRTFNYSDYPKIVDDAIAIANSKL